MYNQLRNQMNHHDRLSQAAMASEDMHPPSVNLMKAELW